MEILLVLGLPLLGALSLALLGARRFAAELNVGMSFVTLIAAGLNVGMSFVTLIAAGLLVLRVIRHGPMLVAHEQFFVDSFNVLLVALTAFVGFTTAVFSRPYMRIEEHHGRLNPRRLRLYHSMYQLFMAAMFLALLTNNMGLLWVAMEAATLSTVLLVSLYRTRASLEAAWKYFILCGVGIAQALFGTILLYFAAEQTGPVSVNMEEALKRTYDAIPNPKWVVAFGDCGACGGIFGTSYASRGGVASIIPVNFTILGCPPSPTSILRGILQAVRIPLGPSGATPTTLSKNLKRGSD